MAAGGGGFTSAFTAFFNVSGNAQEKLDAIRQGSLSLGAGASNASSGLMAVADSLGMIRSRSDPVNVQVQELRNRMVDLAATGQVSSQRLNNMVKELSVLNTTLGSSSIRILKARDDLAMMSAQLRQTEIAANKAGTRGMNFMEDASDSLALSVRRVSSAMQGFMLGTSLLQGNLTGLAFSLIFLQFSGFLRISLAMAAMTVAGGGILKFVRSFVAQRKEIALVSNSFLVVTGSTQAYELATQRAGDIVEDLSLKQGDLKEATEALTQAQLLLRQRGFEATEDRMRVFLNTLLIAQASTGDWKKSVNTANQALIEYIETGLIPAEGGTITLEESNRQAANALVALAPGLVTARQVLDAYIKKMEETDQPVSEFASNLRAVLEEAGDLDKPIQDLSVTTRSVLENLATQSGISLQDIALQVGAATIAMEKSLENLTVKTEGTMGVAGRANRAAVEFRTEMENLLAQGELTIPNVEALITKYGALSEVFNDAFINRIRDLVDILEDLEDIDIDLNVGTVNVPGRQPIRPGDIDPETGLPIFPDVPPPIHGPADPIEGPAVPRGNTANIRVTINNPVVRSEDDIKRVSSDTIAAIRRATKFSNIGLS